MAKVISNGWAKPDHPIYRTGPVIGGKRFYNSSKAAKKKPKPKRKRSR